MIDLTDRFAALADPTRLTIVERLMRDGEMPAGRLSDGARMSSAAVSRHLKVLRLAGLVTQRADGNRRLYAADPKGLSAISRWTESQRAFWDASLDRLEAAIALDKDPAS